MFDCSFEDVIPVAPMLGANTGHSVVGIGVAPLHFLEFCGLDLLRPEKVAVAL